MPNRYRLFAAMAALLGWLSLALQLLLSIQLTVANGQGALTGVWIYFGYFTILTNVLAALALLGVPLMASFPAPHGWQIVADNILHVVMPVLFLLYWWLAVPKATLRWPQVIVWQLYPAAYFAYALIRGAANHWYPYPFLDVGTLGYLRVLINACAVLLVFIGVALLLVALARWQVRRSSKTAALPAQP